MTYNELADQAVWVKEKLGVQVVKDLISRYIPGEPGRKAKLSDIPPHRWEEVYRNLEALLEGSKVLGYAYNTTLTGVRSTQLPPAIAHPYGVDPHVDNTAEQVESLTMKPLQVNRTIETREDAIAAVKELQEKWDLIDDNTVLRQLMDKMEERHGEEFNAFFAATIRQIMVGSGMTELRIDTSAVLLTLAQSAPLRVREAPGYLIYELVEDADV